MPETELEVLQDIRHYIQAGFLALVYTARQIRDKQTEDPRALSEFEDAADILRAASATLGRLDG